MYVFYNTHKKCKLTKLCKHCRRVKYYREQKGNQPRKHHDYSKTSIYIYYTLINASTYIYTYAYSIHNLAHTQTKSNIK